MELRTNYWGQHTLNIGAAPPPAFMLTSDPYLYILSTDLGSDRFEHLKLSNFITLDANCFRPALPVYIVLLYIQMHI